jgi:hypothetical protein
MPSIIDSRVVSTRRRARMLGSPAKKVWLVSPCQPSLMTVTSTLMMSPRLSSLGPGMPWQTTWLIEVQIDFGKAGRPGAAP